MNPIEYIIPKVALVTLLAIFLATSCTPPTGEYECDISTIAPTTDAMPDGWEEKWAVLPPALDTLGALDAYNVVMENEGRVSQHTVYRYADGLSAASSLQSNGCWFFPSSWDWSEASDSENLSLYADRKIIQCGESGEPYLGKRCTAVLQYGQYVSDFTAPIEDGIMSLDEFLAVVQHIDNTFQMCRKQP